MSASIDISVRGGEWPDISPRIETAARRALGALSKDEGELSLVLADDAFVRDLNKTYRGRDRPTNVLSFPQNEPAMLGDVVLAYETVQRESQAQNKTFEDHAVHLTVHGVLHLLGHDHEDGGEAEIMEALEIAILQDLGIKNPYEALE